MKTSFMTLLILLCNLCITFAAQANSNLESSITASNAAATDVANNTMGQDEVDASKINDAEENKEGNLTNKDTFQTPSWKDYTEGAILLTVIGFVILFWGIRKREA